MSVLALYCVALLEPRLRVEIDLIPFHLLNISKCSDTLFAFSSVILVFISFTHMHVVYVSLSLSPLSLRTEVSSVQCVVATVCCVDFCCSAPGSIVLLLPLSFPCLLPLLSLSLSLSVCIHFCVYCFRAVEQFQTVVL